MAHAVESMVSIRETPWHGLGKVLEQDCTFGEAMRHSGLDWRVKLVSAKYNGKPLDDFARVVVRESDNSVLGVVGPNWRPLQNREAFDWFKPFADSGACTPETAGSLHGGRIVWVLARVKGAQESIDGRGDPVRSYVLLSNSHDGSQAVRVGFAPIRVVCWNTLSAAHRDEGSKLLRIRHTRKILPTLAEVRNIMDVALGEFQATAAQYRRLAACKINKDDLRKYVTLVVAKEPGETTPQERTKIEQMIDLALNGRGNKGKEPSLWTAYNGVTEYLAWQQGRSTDSRYQSLWFGQGAKHNDEAFDIALQLAN